MTGYVAELTSLVVLKCPAERCLGAEYIYIYIYFNFTDITLQPKGFIKSNSVPRSDPYRTVASYF